MEFRSLGKSDARVSVLGLGTMTWGHSVGRSEAANQLARFLHAGGNLVDTANVYADGASEEILGVVASRPHIRNELLIATKSGSIKGTRRFDLSPKRLMQDLEGSLRRMRLDYIDLWQVHGWDGKANLLEVLETLENAVERGLARYYGVSNFSGWQLGYTCGLTGALKSSHFVSIQSEYSILQRGVEREVAPLCGALGLGLLAWAPLAKGVLSGKYRRSTPLETRGSNRQLAWQIDEFTDERSTQIVHAVCRLARSIGRSPVQLALAWLMKSPQVTSAVFGARTQTQLEDILSTADLDGCKIDWSEIDDLSAPVTGYPETGPYQLGEKNDLLTNIAGTPERK